MIDRDNLIGVVEVLNKVGDEPFTSMYKHVLEMFSSLAATAVANATLESWIAATANFRYMPGLWVWTCLPNWMNMFP